MGIRLCQDFGGLVLCANKKGVRLRGRPECVQPGGPWQGLTGSDGAAALLAVGPRITALLAAEAAAAAAPPPALTAVIVATVFAALWLAAFGRVDLGLLAVARAVEILLPAAAAAMAPPPMAELIITVAPGLAGLALGSGGGGLSAEEALEPGEEAAGWLRLFGAGFTGQRGALFERGFARCAGFEVAGLTTLRSETGPLIAAGLRA